MLAVLFQLERTQWFSGDELAALQREQLVQLTEHAYRTIPFYQQRLDAAGLRPSMVADANAWSNLPVLRRADLQDAGQALLSSDVPSDHGQLHDQFSSGSTGTPVLVQGTELTAFLWRVLTLRDHLWHGRDFGQSLAAIRFVPETVALYPDGQLESNWGPATAVVAQTGPMALLNIHTPIAQQAEWLLRMSPGYLLTYPSVYLALADEFQRRGERLPSLREARSFGEVLEPACREAIRTAWGVNVVDMYSSQETGYLALQCPRSTGYHVQSETVLLEVLDDTGRPCQPGEVGRVVVTPLHNFAMPLLRYELGDYAEVGEPCSCGRGLKVLSRILGRKRNLVTLPTGERIWPALDPRERAEGLPPIRQFQVVQHSLESIELRLVPAMPLTSADESLLIRYVQEACGHPFRVTLRYVDSIDRGPTGKYEDFVSNVAR